MHALIDILSCFCLLTGAIFSVLGGIGLIRFPDFYARLHGGGITDTMGAGMIILGLLLQAFRAGVDPQAGSEPGPRELEEVSEGGASLAAAFASAAIRAGAPAPHVLHLTRDAQFSDSPHLHPQ